MRKLIVPIISSLLLVPVLTLADHHEGKKTEKRIVIKTDGDIDPDAIKTLIEQAESDMLDGEVDVKVFITADQAMDMVEKYDDTTSHRGNKRIHVIKTHTGPGDHSVRTYTTGNRSMSEGAAKCILKNIDGIASDAAARLLMQACGALNKTED